MKIIQINDNWEYTFSPLVTPLMVSILKGWKKISLPHDASTDIPRTPDSPYGADEGYMTGAGLYYRKSFILQKKASGKELWIEFEGVAGCCEVWINGAYAAKHSNPYTSFIINCTSLLKPGASNEILVHVDNRKKPDSRWYVGCGLYRSVNLYAGTAGGVRPHGLAVRTLSLETAEAGAPGSQDEARSQDEAGCANAAAGCANAAAGCAKGTAAKAVVELSADTGSGGPVSYEIISADGEVIAGGEGEGKVCLSAEVIPWSAENPVLYTVRAVSDGDAYEEKTGFRTIEVSPKEGLKINGSRVKLKGGCVHHGLGLLGAADYESAERMRIQKLKEAGFNAVRLAHNPYGPAIFKVCDEMGMYCIEEAFDEWVLGRTSFGLHITFEDRWGSDLEDMVSRDMNHPSIIMWGTGNEVEERDGSADGYAWSARLAAKVKELDPSRPVSATACALFSEYGNAPASGTSGNQALNMAYDTFAEGRDLWGPATEQYFAPVDVAGYNYKCARYSYDAEKYPDRVIYGSESYPNAALLSWNLAMENDNVIGDFVWTAWDYIGEIGVGRYEVTDNRMPKDAAYPYLTANCSDFDYTGEKRPQGYYRDVIWGVASAPKIFCLPPALTGKKIARLSWGWMPVERNYTYAKSEEGSPIRIYIYADCDEVELFQNGVSLGRKPCGAAEEYIAIYDAEYRKGALKAVSYINGSPVAEDTLESAGRASALGFETENYAGDNLAYVRICAQDSKGRPACTEGAGISLNYEGCGTLLACGTANPAPDSLTPFKDKAFALYNGKAMAIIDGGAKGGTGTLSVTFRGKQYKTELTFAPLPADEEYVAEKKASAADMTIGQLISGPARAVMEKYFPEIMSNPMLSAMGGISLSRLLSMGGGSMPEGAEEALNEAAGI